MTVYLFDRCELDSRRRELRVDGQPVSLQPLVFDLIRYFVNHPGRVIGREELLRAAWRSSAVSASVVARAIMKARRAIGDDATEPRLLHTVARAGYRFDARVSLELQPPDTPAPRASSEACAWRYALLPLQGSAHRLGAGLPALAQLLMGPSCNWQLAPLDDVREIAGGGAADDDAMARACRLLGAQQALALELEPLGDGWRLLLWVGASRGQAQRLQREGRDPLRLLRHVLAECLGEPAPEASELARQAARDEAIAAAWASRDDPQLALQQLQPALDAQASAWTLWLQAKLLQAAGDSERAAEQLALAVLRARPGEAGATASLRAQLLHAQAQLDFERLQREPALQRCDEALALLGDKAEPRVLIPALLSLKAMVLRQGPQREAARQHAERALAASLRTNSQLAEARARLQLGILLAFSEEASATDVAKRAVQLAHHMGVARLEMQASILLTVLVSSQREFSAGLQLARRARHLARNVGDAATQEQAEVIEMFCLLSADRVAEAQQAPLLARSTPQPRFLVQTVALRALLHWKQADYEAALQVFAEGQARIEALDQQLPLLYLRQQRGLALLSAGQRKAGRALLGPLQSTDPVTSVYAAAALAVDDGQPERAVQQLDAWLQLRPGHGMAEMDNRLCLAWLRPEAEDPGQPDAALDSLAASLIDYAPEYLPSRVFVAAYLLRRAPCAAALARWRRLMDEARPLRERMGWMTRSDYLHSLQRGAPRRLPALLTQACL